MSDELLDRLLRFGVELREAGVSVGTGQLVAFAQASALLGPPNFYWAGRTTLVTRQADIDIYNRIFYEYWQREIHRPVEITAAVERVTAVAAEQAQGQNGKGRKTAPRAQRASALELLRSKSFDRLTAEELKEIARLMTRLELTPPRRPSRRRQPSRRGLPDVRRTVRYSQRTGGEPAKRAWRARRRRRRRIILILDVSGSMSSYSRALLVFAHAALRSDSHWEAFSFATRLTRITRSLGRVDPNLALDRAVSEVEDWDGGTRIGECVKQFLKEFGHRGMARGAIVILCSDGLDVGDPKMLSEQMERLGRLAHRVIWLNPLREQVGYQPLARGMKAALPHIDVFASGHNLASLEGLAATLWE